MCNRLRTTLSLLLLALIVTSVLPSPLSATAAGTPYASSLVPAMPAARPFPPGCAAAICDANGKCEKHPGATTKCKSGGGTCTLQSC